VESALADTTALSTEQVEAVRTRVHDWYIYYGRTLPWLTLDFAETDELKWNHEYFRNTLKGFVTGYFSIDHVYYAVEMVMISTLKEHTRLAIEERLRTEAAEEALKYAAPRKTEGTPLIVSDKKEPREKPTKSAKKPAPTKTTVVPLPTEQDVKEQFGLFG
jgi:hypothetical protein